MIAHLWRDICDNKGGLPSTVLLPSQRFGASADEPLWRRSPPFPRGPKGLEALGRVGDYELVDEIARGGMGIVYKARQFRLNRLVALKTVLPVACPAESTVEALRREAEIVGALDHPGIVPVHDFGECRRRPYLCLTLVDGECLAARLRRGRPAPAEAARIAAETAETLQYVHDRGYLHRDVKPANMMIDSSGRARLIDFGLARKIDGGGETALGSVVGTPSYMSPEQASGRADLVGPASDVYSLGAVLFEMLTGQTPTGGAAASCGRTGDAWCAGSRNAAAGLVRRLMTISRRALQTAAEARYVSAGELADDLRRATA